MSRLRVVGFAVEVAVLSDFRKIGSDLRSDS